MNQLTANPPKRAKKKVVPLTLRELREIRRRLDEKEFFTPEPAEEKNGRYYLNSDLEEILAGGSVSEEAKAHCRKFLDARKEWGFLYSGLPMSIYPKAGSWDFFHEDFLRMDGERLDFWLSACRRMHERNIEIRTKKQVE